MDPQRMFGMTPWVRRLLVANLVVFLCQKTVLVDPRFVALLGFDPLFALVRPWSFATYMFLHGGFLHLVFNMLLLFMFGPPVEERMGGRAFLSYYLLCGLGGAAASFLLVMLRPMGIVLGASAAVFGVLLAFAWHWPDQPIYVFPLPAPIPAKWLVTFAVGVSFALALLSRSDGVAHLAHLGGFAAGFLYLKTGDWRLARAERHLRRATQPSVVVHSAHVAGGGDHIRKRRSPTVERDPSAAEIDRVLDKISARGIDSLTPAERRFLADMSRRMRGTP
jgi:membrane associated rhomboid family serine protease